MSVGRGRSAAACGGEADHRQVLEAAADLVIGGEAEVAQLVQGGDPLRRRRATGDRQHPDRFHVPAAALRAAQRPTRQRRPGRRDRIDRVGLALPPTHLPVRAVDLDHHDPRPVEMAGQRRPIRAGALHADQLHLAMAAQPADQALIAGLGRLERFDAEHPAEMIDHGRHMHLGMRVDTRGHRTCRLYDGHRHPFLLQWVQGLARTCREGAGNPGLLAQTRNPFPTRPVSAVSGPADGSFERQPEGVSRFESQTDPETKPTVDTPPLETVDTHSRRTPRSSLCRFWSARVRKHSAISSQLVVVGDIADPTSPTCVFSSHARAGSLTCCD